MLVLLALMLCLSPAIAEEEAETPSLIPADYRLIAQNDDWSIHLKDETLAIIVENRENGKVMYSTVQNPEQQKDNDTWKGFYQSGIVINYIEGVVTNQADFINNKASVEVTELENGFRAKVHFTDLGIGFTAEVTLAEDGLTVFLPQSEMVEDDPSVRCLADVFVYPFLGYSEMGQDEGYMLIPDGQGALIELKDNEGRFSSPYTTTVYGKNYGLEELAQIMNFDSLNLSNDPEQVIMPVYGMAHTADGIAYLSVIDEGDISAKISAYPNGVRMRFDWLTFKYTYRVVYAQQTGPSSGAIPMITEHAKRFDIRQKFLLTKGEEANYTGMAKAYRRYLAESGAFENADTERPFDVQVDFMGAEKEPWIFGTTDVVMTTFDQAQAILEDLKAAGVERVSSVYRGWQTNGLSGGVPQMGYDPAKVLGGAEGLGGLTDYAAQSGVSLYLEADWLSLNVDTHPVLFYSAFKRVNNATFTQMLYGHTYSTGSYLSPPKAAEIGAQALDALEAAGVPGLSLTGITRFMADYYQSGHYWDVSYTRDYLEGLVSASVGRVDTLLNGANAYLWKHANALVNMPIGGSGYQFVTEEVPFLSIALSGQIPVYAEYTNIQANTKRFFLNLIEQGVRPSFIVSHEDPIELSETNSNHLFVNQYELYAEMIVEWNDVLSAIDRRTEGTAIDRHSRVGDMVRVEYENGYTIYINYGETRGVIGGVAVDPLSYKEVGAGA